MARLGSFAASVDLPEYLRPWSAAGLEALLLPGGLPASGHGAAPAPAAPDAPAQGRPSQFLPAQSHPCDHASHAATPAANSPEAAQVQWPEPWAGIAARVRTPPRIIITYASLTDDVTGQADPARRKLFQSILAYMAWPQGTSLFWPCTALPGAAPGLARNIFINGVLHFGVTHIACFGPEAAKLATALFPGGEGRHEVQVITLPAPESLPGLLPHELHRAVAALKAVALD